MNDELKGIRFYVKNGNIVVPDRGVRRRLESQGYYIRGNLGIIDPVEALYLMNENKATVVNEKGELTFDDVANQFSLDLKKFYAYSDLRHRGYTVSMKKNSVTMKNGEEFPLFTYSPSNTAEFVGTKGLLAIVDDDNDITYFIYKMEEPVGKNHEEKTIKFSDEQKRRLFYDLIGRNFRLNSGLKFGTEFIAYENDNDKHSKYMVKILRPGMQWIEIAGLARVANGVRKILLLAIMEERIKYYSVSWLRA